ncbi:trimethylamine methyltransferase family protein [Halobaculum gomorrense]|uniref:Trimethylamine:corrinoid methyltransferase n=1 Tax=Halobaculum gomorrense TaxID=43928 RepID=A0A1M5PE15_9EURY|nr:trimethylamine methyltransferase family protein [Halobaculum gomorrense]SHH00015.1 trimethylamine:corrinoid methyltransferase [Halobaculum gomorrense]
MTDDRGTLDFPSLERLDADGAAAVHEASMRIVEELGVQLNHDRARALLDANGATVDGDLVRVPRDLVEECVASAPAEFTLHARNPDNDVTVGGDGEPVRAPGHGPANVVRYGAERRRGTRDDYETLLKLAQTEDVISCTGYRLCELDDVPPGTGHYEMLWRALTHTDKPVMGSTYGADRARDCLELVAIAVDDPDLSKPYVAGLVNTTPPRSIDEAHLGGLMTYAEHGQPPIVSSFTMAGASGPASLPAAMAQANAENLVAITLTQLVNPGTPVVYGVPSSNIDPRHGSLSIGSPESALFVSFAARMGRYYGLPSRGGGGLSDAKAVDYHGGFESMLLQTVTAFSGIDYVLNAVGVMESYSTVSPEKFVLDCDAIRYLDRFRAGYRIDEGTFALDAMAATDPAGHFLDEGAPDESAFFSPAFVDKRTHGDWSASGGKSAMELAHERVEARLAAYERPPMDADIERDLAAYVERHT